MIFSRFQKLIQQPGLLRDGGAVVVAVSGGMDSMVLLDCFARLWRQGTIAIVASHMNHGLRGKASDADEALVRHTCERQGIACAVAHGKPRRGSNLQDAARRLRYAFFEEVAREHGARAIATGHHADDQAETMLLHLIRGSGLSGLAGIRSAAKRGDLLLLRPLLSATREAIATYAKRHRIAYREDASNTKAHYTRNRLRHDLIPALKKYNPRIVESLSRAAGHIAADSDALELIAREAFADIRAGEIIDGVALSRTIYQELPEGIRIRVFVEAFAEASGGQADLNADQLRRMDAIALGPKPRGEYCLPAPWRFFRRGDLLIIHSGRQNISSRVASRGNREANFR